MNSAKNYYLYFTYGETAGEKEADTSMIKVTQQVGVRIRIETQVC